MPEGDSTLFRDAYEVWKKWRGKIISPWEWEQVYQDICKVANDHDWKNNPLALHLCSALVDTFDDLYRDGKTPVLAGFIDRGDL